MLNYLREISPYNALSTTDLESFAGIATKRKYKKNMVLIQQGDETNSLYILLEGEMKVYIEDDQGRELTVKMLKPGDSFGELALLGDFPRVANVMTTTDCLVSTVSKGSYLGLLKENPQISLALIESLANMVRETTEELGSIALLDVYGRLTHILEKYAVNRDGEKQVPKFTHREISNMIGSSREMVSKIMKELEKGGYISVADEHYLVNKNLPARW
jgi:CRP/FNR family transcriptional regulator, cyclic AMP receptor protein